MPKMNAKFEICQASMIILVQVGPAHQGQMWAQHQWRYKGADKSLALPDWKNNWKVATFRPTRRSLLPRRSGWTDNLLNFFLSGLPKLEFGHC